MAGEHERRTYAHARLRRLRHQQGLSQVTLARRLGISTSYLNQIEHDHRPLTAPVLRRLGEVLGVDPEFFSGAQDARLATDLRAALADEACGDPVPTDEIPELVRDHPDAARALVKLHRRYRDAAEQAAALGAPKGGDSVAVIDPHDEVRDFFYTHHNHFAALEEAAEHTAGEVGLLPGHAAEVIAERLTRSHGVTLRDAAARPAAPTDPRRYDPDTRVLTLSPRLTRGQRAFQMATQLAVLEHHATLDAIAREAELTTLQATALARIGLANYYAGALLMPYTDFHRDAEELRYDVELLQERYGVGFETICHRLSTLQRPGTRGVPFAFLRVDRAGNISKRQSATDFHFSRMGGTCPLWTVYEAFSAPGRILTQVASMPDGRRYFWAARTVTRGGFGYDSPRSTFAVALGCELRHAHRLVYSEGFALDDPRAATPIGLGCRICERRGCPQRAHPPAGGQLAIDQNERTYVPYPVVSGPGANAGADAEP